MIDLVDIHVNFGDAKALEGLCLHVKRGSLLGIIGPGGSGKSTLCKTIAGLVMPSAGVLIVNDVNLAGSTRKEVQEVQKHIGVQFQNDALFEHMTVLENVSYPLERLSDLEDDVIEHRACHQIDMVGLKGFEARLPNRLSGGQRRRVALARACITRPSILVCDDPTAGLDPVTSRRILDMIAKIRHRDGSTVLVVSSDVVGILSVSSRVAMVWSGKVIEEQDSSQFIKSERAEVKRFLSDAALPFEGWRWS